jgi:hypothetical protein
MSALTWGNRALPFGRDGSLSASHPLGTNRREAIFALLAIDSVVDEVLDHPRIGERRNVAEMLVAALGDRSEDSPHDLPDRVFGK